MQAEGTGGRIYKAKNTDLHGANKNKREADGGMNRL